MSAKHPPSEKNVRAPNVTSCLVCGSPKLERVIDLGMQPWCNNFLSGKEASGDDFYPLRLIYCHNCSTPQLDYRVPKEVMFSDHTYLSGITSSLSGHFLNVAKEVDSRFFGDIKQKSVLDIGSNDGTQLQHFKNMGYDVLGVESSKTTAQIANASGIPTINDFFNYDFVCKLGREFHVINAAGVFFHLEELHSATDGIRAALKEDGVFVVQFLYMKRIVENLAFDQIYHEHLLYYNLLNIEVLLNQHGLSMFDAYLAPIHGGSVVGFITHRGKREPSERLLALREAERLERANEFETYVAFGKRTEALKEANLIYLNQKKRDGKRIFGFGAPAKGNTLLNYFGIGTRYIDCLVEKNALRRGLYSPGMKIPIIMEGELIEQPDIYYVLAWNFKKEILANNLHLIDRGVEFYFPINPKD